MIEVNAWFYDPHLSEEKKLQRRTNYFIAIYCILLISPFFSLLHKQLVLSFMFFLIFIAWRRGIKLFDLKILGLLLFGYGLIFIQNLLYQGLSFSILYIPLKLFYVPYLIYRILGLRFILYIQQVIFIIALYTFPIWMLQSFVPFIDEILQKLILKVLPFSWNVVPRSLLFYTAAWGEGVYNQTLGFYRNSGAFHEPGAFGVFLFLAIVLNMVITKRLYNKRNLFLFIALLTTLSTTAYIVLFILMLSDIITRNLNPAIKVISILIFMFAGIQVYQSGDFLQEKVNNQFEDQVEAADQNVGRKEARSGRFYAFFTSLKLFTEHPLFGRGIAFSSSEKASGEMHREGSFTYGITGILSTYGLLFCVFYVNSFYRGFAMLNSICHLPKVLTFLIFLSVNLSILTQIFILSVVFVFIFIIGYLNENSEIEKFRKMIGHAH
jgi:hypothetical protein